MAVSLLYSPVLSFLDANGNAIPFARLYSYQAGTSTPMAIFQDPAGLTPHPNPAIADSGGRLTAYLTLGLAYKLNVLDENSVQVSGWPIDMLVVSPNGDLALINDHADTVAEFQQTRNMGVPGGENLPTNAEQEIETLRYALAGFGAASPWYVRTQNMQAVGDTGFYNMDGLGGWPDAVSSAIFITLRLPLNYVQGDVTLTFFRRSTVATGTAWMFVNIYQTQDGQSETQLFGEQRHYIAGDLLTHATAITFTPAAATANTVLKAVINRDGAHGGDTLAGSIVYTGHSFTYTALRLR